MAAGALSTSTTCASSWIITDCRSTENVAEVMNVDPLEDKFRAFNLHVI